MQQLLGQVVGSLAAADNHGALDPVGLKANGFQKILGRPSGGNEGDDVSLLHLKVTGRNENFLAALHRADQDIVCDGLAQKGDGHAVQHVALRDLELNQLGLSVRKGVYFQCSGEVEDARGLLGCLQLRVDNHGQSQLFPQVADLGAVVRCAHPGNGSAAANPFCNRAAQQIELVGVGDGDDEVGVLDAGLHLNAVAGAVAHNAHDVKQPGDALDALGGLVDDGEVMALPAELFDQGGAHLAAAHDDDAQSLRLSLFGNRRAFEKFIAFPVIHKHIFDTSLESE